MAVSIAAARPWHARGGGKKAFQISKAKFVSSALQAAFPQWLDQVRPAPLFPPWKDVRFMQFKKWITAAAAGAALLTTGSVWADRLQDIKKAGVLRVAAFDGNPRSALSTPRPARSWAWTWTTPKNLPSAWV
jgi:hypothetical protein